MRKPESGQERRWSSAGADRNRQERTGTDRSGQERIMYNYSQVITMLYYKAKSYISEYNLSSMKV